jgi:PHAX RNA-binding domain
MSTMISAPPSVVSPEALADVLGETTPEPRQLLRRLVKRLGPDRCAVLLTETLAVEAQGGLLRQDGQRRTVGGTFFHLARAACTPSERTWIFFPPAPTPRVPKLPAVVVPSTWASLAQLKQHIPRVERGGGTMKLTFVGIPGKLQHDRTCILFRIIPTPAKGLPSEFPAVGPNDTPPWTVVVPLKMWVKQKLPDIVRDHPTEKVLCEGVPVIKDGHCFLFATSVRSVWAERQRQEAQRAAQAQV